MDKTIVIKDDFCFASAIVLVVRSFMTSRPSSIDRRFLVVEDLNGFEHCRNVETYFVALCLWSMAIDQRHSATK